jgi:hypothetical protein
VTGNKFNPTIEIKVVKENSPKVAGSLNTTIPTKTVPTAQYQSKP